MKALNYVLITALLAISCSKEMQTVPIANEQAFTATIDEGMATKTTVEYNGVTTSYDVKWIANESSSSADQISIKDEANNVGIFYADVLSDGTGKNAHFANLSGSVTSPSYHAIYPASIYDSVNDKYILPSTQEYISSTASKNFPMAACSTTADLAFKNLCGIIRINVSNKTGNSITVTGISISDESQGLSGEFSIDWDECEILSVSGTSGITLDVASGVIITNNNTESFMISVPAGTYNKLSIVVATSDDTYQTFVAKKAVTVVKSTYSDFTLKATELFFDYAYGAANCYIATPSTPIDVNITPYGVMEDCVTKVAANKAPVPKGAKVLWADASLATNCSDITLDVSAISSNKITVTTPLGKYGNAVVAIYDDADCEGKILWSYHIWVPSQDPTVIQSYVRTRSNFPVYVMPMNLGAISYPLTEPTEYSLDYGGLYYQWGRKDPICRVKNDGSVLYVALMPRANGSVSATYNSRVNIFAGNLPKQYMEAINYVTQNPTVSISYENGASLPAWAYIENNEDNYAVAAAFWGNPTSSQNPLSYKKSVYDPCPEGYKVSPARLLASNNSSYFDFLIGTDNFFIGSMYEYDSESKTYFPVTAYLDPTFYAIDYNYTTQKSNGGSAYLWENGVIPYGDYAQYRAGVMTIGRTSFSGNTANILASLCNVRCIRDDYEY